MGIEWSVDFSALDEMTARIDGATPLAVVRAAEHIRRVSVELAPIETGNLRGSAEARLISHSTARVYYPGPYARYQHFELQLRHSNGGQALYLEQPMITEAPKVIVIMTQTILEAMG